MSPCAAVALFALALGGIVPRAHADSSVSGTPSATTTRSRTPTQASSVFPLQRIIDNTAALQNVISDSSQPASGVTWWGVALYWPETNPACGPGPYTLSDLYLSIGVPAPSGGALSVSVNLSVSLFVADADTLLPLERTATALFVPVVSVSVPGPKNVRVPLSTAPNGMAVNTTLSRFWVLAWHAWTPGVTWNAVDGPTDVPESGAAEAQALLESIDGGVSFLPSNMTYGGVWLQGRKTACSPTPSSSPSVTQTSSSSGAATPSVSATGSTTPSQTSSQTGSATRSPQTQSASRSPGPSFSRSSTMTPFVTPSRTASRTASGFPPASVIGALDSQYHDLSGLTRTLSVQEVR